MKINDKMRLDWLTKATNWYKPGNGRLALRRTEIDSPRTAYPLALYPRQAIDAAIRDESRRGKK